MLTRSKRKKEDSEKNNVSIPSLNNVDARIEIDDPHVPKKLKVEHSKISFDPDSIVSMIMCDSSDLLDGSDLRSVVKSYLSENDSYALRRHADIQC